MSKTGRRQPLVLQRGRAVKTDRRNLHLSVRYTGGRLAGLRPTSATPRYYHRTGTFPLIPQRTKESPGVLQGSPRRTLQPDPADPPSPISSLGVGTGPPGRRLVAHLSYGRPAGQRAAVFAVFRGRARWGRPRTRPTAPATADRLRRRAAGRSSTTASSRPASPTTSASTPPGCWRSGASRPRPIRRRRGPGKPAPPGRLHLLALAEMR